ncbi:MAG TPA: HNH endonuclease [Vicinamibacteria bacterium]
MQNDILTSLARLSDAGLVARVKSLVARERDATAHLVAHLAELDTRDVHLREGYESLYVYCRDALGLSEGESYNRIEVARAARRFPIILEMLAAGAVNLTAARLLAPHLTPDNHREVLDSARGKKKREIEEIVARLSPRPDVAASVRKLPALRLEAFPASEAPKEAPVAPDASATDPGAPDPAAPAPPEMRPTAEPQSVPRAAVTPLSPDRYKLQLTIGGETLEKLRLAKDMLSHAIPSGDDAAVLDRALTALLADLARKKFADTRKPRRTRAKEPRARDASAAVKRAVWVRDLGRCKFIGPTGHRCYERRFVEFHHIDPYALGGEATVEKIELRCRRHNDYEGRLYFGKRRRDDTGAVREKATSYGPKALEAANLFQNKLAGGAAPSTRYAGVEPQR